jgi:propanol-preferring alcohol dehydrogenase
MKGLARDEGIRMMRVAEFRGGGVIEIGERPAPAVGAGEVMVRVLRCALCGSDLKLLGKGASWTPGHEILGRVDQPGHALHGRRVLVYIPVFCGACPRCRAGDTHLCDNGTDLIGWNRPGGYGEALAVPEQCLLPVPDDIADTLAPLLLDTIGTAAHAVRLALRVVARGGRVLILGAGPIGMGAILAAGALGFPDITVSEPRAGRLQAAVALGAAAFEPGPSRRFDLVLESSGHPGARQSAIEQVRTHGVVVLLGENDAPWPFTENKEIRRKDFWMLRSFYFPIGDYAANLELLRANQGGYQRLVDAEVGLDRFAETFVAFSRGELIKPMLAP